MQKTVLRTWLPFLAIIAATLLVYARSLQNGFVTWDDGLLITENPVSQSLTPASIWQAFTMYDPELYIPLTFLTFQLNHAIGGLEPFGYHLVNLLLHIGSALLLVTITERLTKSRLAGIIVGFLFALHPLNVEAVAWASARKDVLSGFFFLLSLQLWLAWRQSNRRSTYIWCLVSFTLALLSKVNVIMLPVLLVLIELYENRFTKLFVRSPKSEVRSPLFRTLPFFSLSVLFGIIAALGKSGRNTGLLFEKMLIGAKASIFYLEKLVWPQGFSVLYPYTDVISIRNTDLLFPFIAGLVLTILAVALRKRSPLFTFAWIWYVVLLLPSFTNFAKGHDALRDVYFASDRYAYLAAIGPFIVIAASVTRLSHRLRSLVLLGLVGVFGLFGFLSYHHSLTWHDSESLFRNVLAHYPKSHVALSNIGTLLYQRGERAKALEYYQASLAVRPNSVSYFNLGVIAMESHLDARAEEFFRKAIEQRPWDAQALTNLGVLLLRRGALPEAISTLEAAMNAKATPAIAFSNLGLAYERQGRMEDALRMFEDALKLDAQNGDAIAGKNRLTMQR